MYDQQQKLLISSDEASIPDKEIGGTSCEAHSRIKIEIEQIDGRSTVKGEGNVSANTESDDKYGKPYIKTIAFFKLILTKKMAPIDKLFSLQKGWQVLFDEIHEY